VEGNFTQFCVGVDEPLAVFAFAFSVSVSSFSFVPVMMVLFLSIPPILFGLLHASIASVGRFC